MTLEAWCCKAYCFQILCWLLQNQVTCYKANYFRCYGYTYVNFEELVKLALKLVNCLNFKAFICMYSEIKSGMSSGSTVIFYVLGNQHHRLQLLFPVFPVVKMCIRAVAVVQVVVVQIQTQVLQCVFRAVKLVIKKHGLHCNQAWQLIVTLMVCMT